MSHPPLLSQARCKIDASEGHLLAVVLEVALNILNAPSPNY
nr:MAG TPA: hypothetical protein [Bacteriophage sp.]